MEASSKIIVVLHIEGQPRPGRLVDLFVLSSGCLYIGEPLLFHLRRIFDEYLKTDRHLWDSHRLRFIVFVVSSKIPLSIIGDGDTVMGFSLLLKQAIHKT